MPVAAPAVAPSPVRPFLKWAGGKKQLLPAFEALYPAPGDIGAYHEPFVGSGAVFFHVKARLRPRSAVLSDSNAELMNAFQAVRDDVEDLIAELEGHAARHGREHFYAVREQLPSELQSSVARAARFIYLNKTCFNGLYRVNSRGRFNVPMGRYRDPAILDVERLRRASRELAGVDLLCGHFPSVLERAQPGDFVYFDPPYVPVSSTSYFTSYTEGAFGPQEQRLLAGVFRVLADRGCRVMLSNSDTRFVHRLYEGFTIHKVLARRNINSNAEKRGRISEVVVTNYRDVGDGPAPRARSKAWLKAANVGKRGTGASL